MKVRQIGKLIHVPPAEADETEVIDGIETTGPRELLDELKEAFTRQRLAVDLARPALARLVEVMRNKTGQSYKLRALLYSLWNGMPTSVLECVGLDFELRSDLCAVIQAWGYGRDEWEFFYDAIKEAVTRAGLWQWFLEAGEGHCESCGRKRV